MKSNTYIIRTALGAFFMFTLGLIAANAQTPDNTVAVVDKPDTTATKPFSGGTSARPLFPPPTAKKSNSAPDNWTGFYVGGYGGGIFGRATANTSTVFAPTGYFAATSVNAIAATGRQAVNPNGFTGGGQAGYNYQSGNWVVGAEADFGAFTANKTTSGTATYPCCAPSAFTVTQSVKTNWLFTARPRFGYSFNNTLVYATGGLALTDVNYQAVFTDTFATANETGGVKQTRAGWTGGGGIEYNLGNRWSVKGEYLYTDFRRITSTSTNLTAFTPSQSFPVNIYTHSIYLRDNTVRFGINYRF